MGTIDIDDKIKKKLENFKKQEGCKTFSEAIRVLLWIAENKKDKPI